MGPASSYGFPQAMRYTCSSPGMRGLELWNPVVESEETFEDIDALAATCKFRDCSHEREPKCAVRAALASGALTQERLARFRKV